MGEVGIGHANAGDPGHVPGGVQHIHAREVFIQGHAAAQVREQGGVCDAQGGSLGLIHTQVGARIGRHDVEPVIAAVDVHDHKDGRRGHRRRCGRGRGGRRGGGCGARALAAAAAGREACEGGAGGAQGLDEFASRRHGVPR